MSRILSFYNKILSCGSLTSDVVGNVFVTMSGASRPFSHNGKAVVLPTRDVLLNPKKDNMVIFHPLSENVLRGETDVMERYRKAINLTLNYRIGLLFGTIVELATSPAEHNKLNPEHLSLVVVLKDADDKTFAAYEMLRKAMPPADAEKCFVNIFIKKNAHLKRDYRRAAIVSFPFYEELIKDNGMAFGVKLRKKDHAAFKQLFEAIFPGIGEKNEYSRGGESDLAPTLDALLKAIVGLAGQINSVVDTYEDVLPSLSDLRFTDDWVDEANNLDSFTNDLRLLPSQVGNEGSIASDALRVQPVAVMPQAQLPMPVAPPLAPAWGQPQQRATPVINESGLLDMNSLILSNPELAALNGPQYYGQPTYGQPQLTGMAALRARGSTWNSPMTQFTGQQRF